MAKNRVDVAIDGQIITLLSEDTEEYLQALAEYIDKKLTEVKSAKSGRPISDSLRTMHIAANIADDYFKTLHSKQNLEELNKSYVKEMEHMQEENLLLMDRIHDLQAQLTLAMEQFKTELATMSNENNYLEEKVANYEELKSEVAELISYKQDLEEQLRQAKNELDEYISTFDDKPEEKKERLNVVSFSKY